MAAKIHLQFRCEPLDVVALGAAEVDDERRFRQSILEGDALHDGVVGPCREEDDRRGIAGADP